MQVVRYTALVSGIFYGIVHRRTLQREADAHKAEKQAKQHESWVEQAKKEYAKKKEQGLSGLLSEAKDKVVSATSGGGLRGWALLLLAFKRQGVRYTTPRSTMLIHWYGVVCSQSYRTRKTRNSTSKSSCSTGRSRTHRQHRQLNTRAAIHHRHVLLPIPSILSLSNMCNTTVPSLTGQGTGTP